MSLLFQHSIHFGNRNSEWPGAMICDLLHEWFFRSCVPVCELTTFDSHRTHIENNQSIYGSFWCITLLLTKELWSCSMYIYTEPVQSALGQGAKSLCEYDMGLRCSSCTLCKSNDPKWNYSTGSPVQVAELISILQGWSKQIEKSCSVWVYSVTLWSIEDPWGRISAIKAFKSIYIYIYVYIDISI